MTALLLTTSAAVVFQLSCKYELHSIPTFLITSSTRRFNISTFTLRFWLKDSHQLKQVIIFSQYVYLNSSILKNRPVCQIFKCEFIFQLILATFEICSIIPYDKNKTYVHIHIFIQNMKNIEGISLLLSTLSVWQLREVLQSFLMQLV